ncbi:glycosyltranserase family 2 [Micractinium conductrix]|uniref:Glycosyltranserase family 2 n=1 Tax=Micractinium conductrix TaxID=554055 RepID=A0A2P6V978_9CHLO|nr:glycosyltranserase family 2 [Micractinium conductrix]|eukprot:PSC70639.1 glycosyltranserase family 2 [Micractinium conductrix]
MDDGTFTDVDEFVVISDGTPDLPTLLRDYEGYGALASTWRMFGSNGHLTRQPHVLTAYTSCLEAELAQTGTTSTSTFKTIANTALTTRATSFTRLTTHQDSLQSQHQGGVCSLRGIPLPQKPTSPAWRFTTMF